MLIGTLASIWRFPVKSGRGERLDEVAVDATGVRGDRTCAYFVASPGHARTGKTYRGKENERLHVVENHAGVLALAARDSITLERRDGQRFFDDAPVSVLLDRWLEKLSACVGYPVEPIRFRPNLFVRAVPDLGAGEVELQGRTLSVGSVLLVVRYPIERCVVPTYDPAGGASDPRILRFIAQERDIQMGVYCDVAQPGVARVGDPVSSS
ncbi:MAG: MOSC domain-containing protein [Candidatus Eremiobacteraeota bacterium]|nr:MOSC domain-containing protein [Candidatus Eremiobacteraeota bacterium]MBV8374182.1 MOSC domain-containing protein [Candidatus Eremiobacteraeota bacterium]